MFGESFALAAAVAWALSGTMLKMVSSRFGATYIVAARAVASLLTALAVAAAFGVADSLGTLTVIVVLSLIASRTGRHRWSRRLREGDVDRAVFSSLPGDERAVHHVQHRRPRA